MSLTFNDYVADLTNRQYELLYSEYQLIKIRNKLTSLYEVFLDSDERMYTRSYAKYVISLIWEEIVNDPYLKKRIFEIQDSFPELFVEEYLNLRF